MLTSFHMMDLRLKYSMLKEIPPMFCIIDSSSLLQRFRNNDKINKITLLQITNVLRQSDLLLDSGIDAVCQD